MKFRAIIWDCDGVLIDSEVLACRVVAEYYTRAGFPLKMSEYIWRFAGRSETQIADIILQEPGRDLAASTLAGVHAMGDVRDGKGRHPRRIIDAGRESVESMARTLEVGASTLYRALRDSSGKRP
jgi:beta-phosphoglucomutase-like phosphatase (HAD superfamily)